MSGEGRLRLFFGVPLDGDGLRDAACGLQDTLQEACRRGPRVKWVERANLHLTLKFIGDTPAARLDEVIAVAREAAAERAPEELELRGVGCFPPRGAPRTIWLGVRGDSPELARLAQGLDRRLAEAGLAEPDRRPFAAHITLGRVKGAGGGRELREAIERLRDEPVGPMTADSFVLYSSDLRPQGPAYTNRGEFQLSR